ncbi:MAG: twin-arginine translocase subunit TatC [Fimbriimonadaceae bacterium]|nr:twin-arginine translocase subunit TatC [Fimbriimonadaceae bacterium]
MRLPLKGRTTSTRNSSEDPEEFRATLGEHLEELRDRILRILLIIVAGWVLGWFIEPPLYTALSQLVRDSVPPKLLEAGVYSEAFRNATEPFMLKFKLSFMLGLGITLPFLVMQLWGFVKPGLRPSERKPLALMAPFSVVLFAIGMFFCWLILPSAFQWFFSYIEEFPGTQMIQEPGTMVFFILKMMMAFGIGFQLPLIVFMLGKVGLIGPDTLVQYWRQATALIFFAAAILTPSQDAFSMLMMAVPLSLLFILSVMAVRFTTRNSGSSSPELDDLD